MIEANMSIRIKILQKGVIVSFLYILVLRWKFKLPAGFVKALSFLFSIVVPSNVLIFYHNKQVV